MQETLQLKYLPARQMNVRHHAARAAAAYSFENRQRGFDDLREFLNSVALFDAEREASGRGNCENGPAIFALKLKHITGKLLDLLEIDVNDFATRRFEAV